MNHCITEPDKHLNVNHLNTDDKKLAEILIENKAFRVLTAHGNSALLFNSELTISVVFKQTNYPNKILKGNIVKPFFNSIKHCSDGMVEIERLSNYQHPQMGLNLFELVPHEWVKDRTLVDRAIMIINTLPGSHRYLFNAIFWDAGRFERFCRQPSSMIGHHSEPNGNLRHTIEVAEEMYKLCLARNYANVELGVLAALLHDCGKADEYLPNGKGGWDLTLRGKLLGHKISAVEWIVAAVARWNIKLPQDHYEGLLHMMTAIPHTPSWMGIRSPATPESLLLSMADRLSGHDDLMTQTIFQDGGFGRYHKHLGMAPFKVRG